MKKVFVIIVTYKGHKWYERCFTSLRNSSYPVQTIVIDNASNDGTVEYIRDNFPEIHLIESDENLGFGKANNIGMRYALDHGCDYVFLLNQDAWVEPKTFHKLMEVVEKYDNEYGIYAPLQINREKTKVLDGIISFLSYPTHTCYSLFSDLLLNKVKEIYSVREINAAAWLIPKITLDVVGGFDPIFLHYGEDWNYVSRVLYHGLKIGLIPSVAIVHDCVDRVEQREGYAATYDKWLLERVTDVLKPSTIVDDFISSYRRAAILKFITFNMKSFTTNIRLYTYLKKIKKDILKSRECNIIKGRNWL